VTGFEGMSPAMLHENRSAIRQFIEYLLSPDGAGSRKRWRMLAILEQGSKGPIGEIFLTPHGPVFVSRMTVDDERGYRAEDADNHQSPIRGIEPVTGEPGQLFDMASRRALFMVDAGYLIARIQAGDDTVVLRPGLTSSQPVRQPTAQQMSDYRARVEAHRKQQRD